MDEIEGGVWVDERAGGRLAGVRTDWWADERANGLASGWADGQAS